MIDGSEKRNRQLVFELQYSHVCEKRSNKNMKFCLSLFQSNHNNGNPDVGKFRHDYT